LHWNQKVLPQDISKVGTGTGDSLGKLELDNIGFMTFWKYITIKMLDNQKMIF
jgi:hypothetical protein